ncbi:histone-lysine N-methyltransferase SETMAR-like [Tachypleus tridentatus]|uniref:histone-lysine N-methyltransferase SETMAR-like n=1 Tax=Tachypleus tridentatus TaxID=6853 RepID=UPI003FD6678F
MAPPFLQTVKEWFHQNVNDKGYGTDHFKLGHNVVTAARNINHAFGDGTVNECTAQRWFKRFCSDKTSLENESWRCPYTSNNEEELKPLVESNTCQTMRELVDNLNVKYSTASQHHKAIDKVKKLDKWVPHELIEKPSNEIS